MATMALNTLVGNISRRILVNYQVDPAIVGALLPQMFRPKLVRGRAIAGICLIRLENLRPKGLPAFTGVSSENSAHRVAVEWDQDGSTREGVFVLRRDSDSAINALVGGRWFPGVHQLSLFSVDDRGASIRVRVDADDYEDPLLELDVESGDGLPHGSVFDSLETSSDFFAAGCAGYSLSADGGALEGLRLEARNWNVEPLRVFGVRSAFYDNRNTFPAGSIRFDHALIMRNIEHEWQLLPEMPAAAAGVA